MVNVTSGLDTLNMLKDEPAGAQNEFTSLKSGDTKTVKVIDFGDFIGVNVYSIFKVIPTFIPKNFPKLSQRGNPVDDFTPFDLAYKYHADQSKDFGDHHSTEAYKYKLKPRFAFGFYDLDEKEFIVVDFSKKQAQGLVQSIQKQHDQGRLGKRAFELDKSGQGTGTTVSLSPLPLDDLTDEQQKAFEESPEEFDKTLFEGLYFEQDEDQMVESLTKAGFDVSLIGYDKPSEEETEENPFENADPTQQF